MSIDNIKTASPQSQTAVGRIKEMIRVDQAGEYAAVQIYSAQLAVFKHAPGKARISADLAHMAEDEQRHLKRFNELAAERKVRPTAFNPIWHAASYALGAATALMGEKAAHACTEAVEDVIEDHYKHQIDELERLGDAEKELKDTIVQFRDEEIAHKEHALANGAKEAPGYPVLANVIRAGCKFAIRVAEKV